MNKNRVSFKKVLIMAGAFASYSIGSGFAAGQNEMQYFCSWGGIWPFVLSALCLVMVAFYCAVTVDLAREEPFEKPSDAYEFYFGKGLGKFLDAASFVIISCVSLAMFAGCGATLNQYFGIPTFIGSLGLGIVALLIVWLGLEKLTNFLGYAGILIIVFIAIVGFYAAFLSDGSIMESQKNMLTYVAEGKFLQISILGIKNPIVSGVFYGSAVLLPAFPFLVAISHKADNKKEAVCSGILSSVLYTLGLFLVIITLLKNLDYIAANGTEVPMLSAITNILPSISVPYMVVLVIAILTTATGFLWVVGRRFADDRTAKQRIIVGIICAIGIIVGAFVPFSKLVNIIYPIEGMAGFVIFIGLIVNMIRKPHSKHAENAEK